MSNILSATGKNENKSYSKSILMGPEITPEEIRSEKISMGIISMLRQKTPVTPEQFLKFNVKIREAGNRNNSFPKKITSEVFKGSRLY